MRLVRLLPLILVLSCASQKETVKTTCPETPQPPPISNVPLSPQAAQVFGFLGAVESGSGLDVDLDKMEQLGFSGPMSFMRTLPRSLMSFLPLADTLPDEAAAESPDYVRYVVALAAMDKWADLPVFRRMGLWIPRSPAGLMGGLPGAVIVFATDKGTVPTNELFQGLAAIANVLVERGQGPSLTQRGNSLCAGDPRIGAPLCLTAAEGLLMISIEGNAQRLLSMASTGKRELSTAHVLLAHFEFNPEITINLLATGTNGTQVHAEVLSPLPDVLEGSYARVNDLVAKWDARQEERRQLLEAAVQSFNSKLSADPNAPASLKKAASEVTADSLRDPDGYWGAMRSSLKVAKGPQAVTADFQLPANATRKWAEQLSPSNPLFTIGALAAIAIPNFQKFQCRSKQSEARSNLKAIYVAQNMYFGEHSRLAKTFEEMGFEPEPGTRYNYCLGNSCVACTAQGCSSQDGMGACAGLTRVPSKKQQKQFVFQACAYGQLDSDDAADVWTVGEDGQPQNLTNDCL